MDTTVSFNKSSSKKGIGWEYILDHVGVYGSDYDSDMRFVTVSPGVVLRVDESDGEVVAYTRDDDEDRYQNYHFWPTADVVTVEFQP